LLLDHCYCEHGGLRRDVFHCAFELGTWWPLLPPHQVRPRLRYWCALFVRKPARSFGSGRIVVES